MKFIWKEAMNRLLNEHKRLFLFCIVIATIAIINIGLAIYGGIKSYSPVPFWDMWDSYLNFFVQFTNGNVDVVWKLHNEHRIVLSRLLFILDFKLFNGTGWFLIALNYVLVFIICFVYYRFLSEISEDSNKYITSSFLFFLIIWLFSWIQQENFTWGFQSQFILAQLLPLSSLYLLHKSDSSRYGIWYFTSACILGFMSIGTMANGVLALPLMFIMALLLCKNWKYTSVLFIITIIAFLLYFWDYQAPAHHGSLLHTAITRPLELIKYVLLYIGSPWYRFAGKGLLGKIAAYSMALFFLVSLCFYSITSIKEKQHKSLHIALVLFILYVLITAAATAGGRLIFGLEQALSSRYTTPVLMAWASLFMLFFDSTKQKLNNNYRTIFKILLLVVIIPVTIFQCFALNPKDDIVFEKKVAALAIEMGIEDQEQISCVYPDAPYVMKISREPVTRNLSVFSVEPIKDAAELIGKIRIINDSMPICQGNIEESIAINTSYLRISGWMYCNGNQHVPQSIIFVDNSNTIIGYAITGSPRHDVEKVFGSTARYAGFKGYIRSKYAGARVHCLGRYPECRMDAVIPICYNTPFIQLFRKTRQDIQFAKYDDIVTSNLHLKNQYLNSKIEGFSITDSNGVNTPKICIRMKKYGGMYIKTEGDIAVEYRVYTDEREYFKGTVHSLYDWTILHFVHNKLPDSFIVEFYSSNVQNKGHFMIALKE